MDSEGLHALVMAPLPVESRVFGVLVAARREPFSFTSGDCEFLQQLSEHVALSAHQGQHYSALQRAVDDVAQTVSRMREFYRQRAPAQMLVRIPLNRIVEQVMDLTKARWLQRHAAEREGCDGTILVGPFNVTRPGAGRGSGVGVARHSGTAGNGCGANGKACGSRAGEWD